jgi:hypothetical protein
MLFQLLGKRNNVVPTVEPELTRSTIDPILIALLTQQQQQQDAQHSNIIFQNIPVITTCVNPVSGILNNQPLSFLLIKGFSVIYNYTYNHVSSTNEINEIRNECVERNSLCMGGLDSRSPDVLLVVACGCCLDVLKVTEVNQPQLHNGVYWYNTPGYSIGISPNSTIALDKADGFDMANNQRISWHLNEFDGGYRVGSIVTFDPPYFKIYLKSP